MSHGLHACKRIYCTFPLCAWHGFEKKYYICKSSTSRIFSWLICWVLREDNISFEFFIFCVECGYTLGELEELWNIILWPTWWGKFIFDSLTKWLHFFQQSSCAHLAVLLYAAQFLSIYYIYIYAWNNHPILLPVDVHHKRYFCDVFFL